MAESLVDIDRKILEREADLDKEQDKDQRGLLLSVLVQLRQTKNILLRQQEGAASGDGGQAGAGAGMAEMEEACLRALKRHKPEEEVSVSRVGRTAWEQIKSSAHLEVQALEPDVLDAAGADQPEDSEPFKWLDTAENQQSDRYLPYLKSLFPLPHSLEWLECGNSHKNLLTTFNTSGMLHYTKISGNTDVAIISQGASKALLYNTGLYILFELKKEVDQDATFQALCQVFLANIHSRRCKPLVFLTDLRSSWHVYWMDGSIIKGGSCSSRAAAVALVRAAVSEAAAAVAAATAAARGRAIPTPEPGANTGAPAEPAAFSARHPAPVLDPVGAPDVANIAELQGMLPEGEFTQAITEACLGKLLCLPLFHGMAERLSSPPPEPQVLREPYSPMYA